MLNKFVDEVHERIMIHTNHAVNEGHKQIKIIGEDSDCVALLSQNWKTWATQGLTELWYEYTCSYKKKVIGIHILAEKLPPELLLTIVAVHNLTGSLYTSRIGTKQAAINNNPMEYLSICGKGWEYHHGSSFSIQNLSATSASIRLHILRAWYITYKQLNLLNYFYQVPLNFTDFGYEIIKNEICPKKI
ncbi:Protein of unknown function [Cotesia congregata]|uniref:Uncharacterized protein n=1 Tax=Cotesia congregata TaxID=51543 RepID=A0A8J2HNM9_COTCN|nr:Protein of unknown function [Cotesia congregata]